MTSAQPAPRLLYSLLGAVLAALLAAPSSQAAACTPPITNEVACENTLPGAGAETWNIVGAGDPSIQGFATSMSVDRGQTISFKIKSETPDYRIDILRLGFYGGDGARVVASDIAPTGQATQPECITDSSSGLIDCGNWSVSASWNVPNTAVSGVFIAHLIRNDTGGDSHITFVVRDDADDSDIVLQTSDTTWQAYNAYGGNSTYRCSVSCPPGNPKTYKGALKVSYNRPLMTAVDSPGSALFQGAEYNMIRFLEASGYDVSYISGVDTHRRGQLLLNHELFISSGHDEYWSARQRDFVTAARDAGVNLAFFSGNEMFWKHRFEPSADGSGTPDRTLVAYKDTHFDLETEQDPVEWTGTWRDPRFTTPDERVVPENALIGQSFLVNSGTSVIHVPNTHGQLRIWRNTGAATLSSGESLALAPGTLGYEWDQDADNGFRPAGQFRLSSTTVSNVEVFTDYGSTTQMGETATHNLTMYRAASGARVFGAGTVQWAWGLDDWRRGSTPVDHNMQQATVNLFADMGVQPAALLDGLAPATASTDTTAPRSTLSTPPASVADGTRATLSGTASDTGGGVVAGVEVSTDGGATWHPATSGTTNWTYTWIAHGHPSTTVRVRAVDDSGNLESPEPGITVGVSCPCSIWGVNVGPPRPDSGDPNPVEVGVKFRSERYGEISGIRFYKSDANTGTHIGSLWSADGQRLAQATFNSETPSGWQTVNFGTPVDVLPGTTYIASYYAPNGHYAATGEYFYRAPSPGPNGGGDFNSPPLSAITNVGTTANGVYSYGPATTFPVNSYFGANYWVDVRFTPIAPPGQVTGVSAAEAGRTSVSVSWTDPSSGGKVRSYRITPYVGSTPQPPTTVTGSPPATAKTITGLTNDTTYTFVVEALNPAGAGAPSAPSNPVTPHEALPPGAPSGIAAEPASRSARVTWTAPASDGESPITGYTVTPYIGSAAETPVQAGASATTATVGGLSNGTNYTFKVTARNSVGAGPDSAASNAATPQSTMFDFATPAIADTGDTSAVELGVKFKPDHDGTVSGIRFYKAAANTGTHTGSLWTAGGQRLAQATFTGETASGWQSVNFATPMEVTAGTTYVASYHAPNGHYSFTAQGLASGIDNPPLRAVANSVSANGAYSYGAPSTFPANSYNAANYWVDVLYTLPRPGQATGVTAVEDGPTRANLSWGAPTDGGPVFSYEITPYVGSSARPKTIVTGSPPVTSAQVDGLVTGTTYTFKVEAVNSSGAGPASTASNPVTPTGAVPPSAPKDVLARPATKSAQVSWKLPTSDGSSAITQQNVTPYVDGAPKAATQVGPSATSTTISGLSNGEHYRFKVTATNAAGLSPPSVESNAVTPQATIFDFATPAVSNAADADAVELGVKFTADFNGAVTGVRFYKATANTGTHTGSLWTADGQRLALATFTGESANGWQSVEFDQPVPVVPGTTYVASYHAPNGHYSVTGQGLAVAVANAPLRAIASSVSGNGVYAYGSTSTFPSSTFNATNYSVDVLFAPAPAPGQVTGVTVSAGPESADVSWSMPATGGPVTSYEVTPYVGTQAQTSKTVTGSPPPIGTTITGLTGGTEYTFTVRANNPTGAGPESAHSVPMAPLSAVPPSAPTDVAAQGDSKAAVVRWTEPSRAGTHPINGYEVTPFIGSDAHTPVHVGASQRSTRVSGLANETPYTFRVRATSAGGASAPSAASSAVTPRASIFESATPAVVEAGDTAAVNLGLKFRSATAGSVTGVRFYKATANTGMHIGSLWTEPGNLLAQATFTRETTSGWQAVDFAQPVPIAADTTYVVSYRAPTGHYSVTGAAFSADSFTNPPLSALSRHVSPNGVYTYDAAAVFPTSSFNASNYWVDVLFAPGT